MPALLQGAFVAGVGLGPVVSELDLDLVVREVAGAGTPALGGERVRLRFRAVENIQQLAALLLQRRLKSVGEFVDQVLSVGRTTTGWTLHFRRAGQVPIQTQQDPALVREEAG